MCNMLDQLQNIMKNVVMFYCRKVFGFVIRLIDTVECMHNFHFSHPLITNEKNFTHLVPYYLHMF